MKRRILIVLSCLILLCIGVIGNQIYEDRDWIKNPLNILQKDKELSYPSFLEGVNQGQIEEVIFNSNSNEFKAKYLNDDIEYVVPNPKTETFTEFLLLNNIKVSYSDGSTTSTIFKVLLLGGIVGGIFWYTKSGQNANNLIKNANKKKQRYRLHTNTFNKENQTPVTTLAQVAGNAEAKSMVEDIITFIKNPDKYSVVGARMPKGLLLYGPPGTGKTLMAKAIAGEAGVPFYAMSGSDFVQMYVGVGASRIRNLFNKAKKSEKAVIFIDEIDAIGKKRARNASASNDERDQTLNALLTEMSGFHDNQGIIVIGATNRLDTLDEALLRPGRFDRHIEIGLPDVNARKHILSLYANKKPLADDVNLEELAKSTVYFSGAMLENLINEAAITAANSMDEVINKDHIDKAFYTVIAGAPKTDRSYITEKDRQITAYHEAGHALTTTLLMPDHYISKVTIIPSVKGAGGFNLSIPKDTMFQSLKQMKSNIQVLLAGRAAEEIIFGAEEVTTGASNDIQKASRMVADFLDKYGMDKELGLFSVEALEENKDNQLISKCRLLMNELYEETKILLEDNLPLLENITKELLDKESLSGKDIDRICA